MKLTHRERMGIAAAALMLLAAIVAIWAFEIRPSASQTFEYAIESAVIEGDALRVRGEMLAQDVAVVDARCRYEAGKVVVRLYARASVLAGRYGDAQAGRIDLTIPLGGRQVESVVFEGWSRFDRFTVEPVR